MNPLTANSGNNWLTSTGAARLTRKQWPRWFRFGSRIRNGGGCSQTWWSRPWPPASWAIAAQEAAVLEKYAQASGGLYDPAVLGRYYELLAELKQDAKITQISQTDRRMIPALVNALIDRNNLTLARTVLQNYGRRKTPVWTTTQLAMTGAELKDSTPQVAAAFNTVLNLKPIGEQLGVPADANRLLYGAEWYFYARSYGMHLHRLKDPQAEAYLPAQIEFAPVSAARQSQVGEFRLQNNELSPALAHFEQALELEPASLQGLDGQAVVWMKQGQTEKATANWLKLLASQEELFSLPKLQRVLERVREFKLEATFREPVEKFLKTYVKRNQTYGIGVVLPPALELFGSAGRKSGSADAAGRPDGSVSICGAVAAAACG